MKPTHTDDQQQSAQHNEHVMDSLEDTNIDLSNLEEKERLSVAMSSYYLLYR